MKFLLILTLIDCASNVLTIFFDSLSACLISDDLLSGYSEWSRQIGLLGLSYNRHYSIQLIHYGLNDFFLKDIISICLCP